MSPACRFPWPVVSAPDPDAEEGLPPLGGTHADPEAAPRGPRFGLLPPPSRSGYLPQAGAAQPGLRSRLDAAEDIRLTKPLVEVPKQAEHFDPSEHVNHVPEPYFRILTPGQRVRSVGMSLRHRPQFRALERDGLWFAPEAPRSALQAPLAANPVQLDDDALRKKFLALGLPVSGDRAQLNARLARAFRSPRRMRAAELREECARLGLRAQGTKEEMIQDIERVVNSDFYEQLSMADLQFECAYRNLNAAGTREQLLARLVANRYSGLAY